MANNETNPRVLTGKVRSNKMMKTIVVVVERTVTHPKYKKIMRRRTVLHAHDEHQVCKVGDIVQIKETKPISKTKTWVLVDVVN